MSNVPDNDLVERVASGEERALLELYDRYSNRVYALARRMLGDPMAAEDATQEVFLKLWTRARGYAASRAPFWVWLLAIARHTALDRLRLERRRPPASTAEDPDAAWRSIPDRASGTEEARWRSLYFAVQALPEEQRRVLELAYYQGLSHSQIAEHLGWPIGTVKTRLRLGMEELRRQWLAEEIAVEKSEIASPDV